jgi:hypothetical protein
MQKARYWIVLTFTVLAFVSFHSLAFAIYEFCGVNHLFSLQGLEGVQVDEFQELRRSMKLIADQFIKAYLSVNPK